MIDRFKKISIIIAISLGLVFVLYIAYLLYSKYSVGTAEVTLSQPNISYTVSGQQNTYTVSRSFQRLKPGEYTVAAFGTVVGDYAPKSYNVKINPGKTSELEIALTKEPTYGDQGGIEFDGVNP